MEIIVGTSADVVVIDVMESGGIATGYWNLDRGNHLRTGYYQSSLYCGNVYPGDLNCDQNLDILDVIFIVNITLEETLSTESSDINNDNSTDVLDIVFAVECDSLMTVYL